MMSDQAQLLRQMVSGKLEQEHMGHKSEMHIITVASGKGGVGKSNFSVNLALALKGLGKNPIILDADFGLANVEVILGEHPRYNLSHLINGECKIQELVTESQYGISFISGGSGIRDMSFLPSYQIADISRKLGQLSDITDILIIDTGAGINDIVVKFCNLADQVYIVVTPEPTSITDSYALLKTLVSNFRLTSKVKLVINKADSQKEAHEVYKKLSYVCNSFLKFPVEYAGFVPYDEQLFKAVKQQVPIFKYNIRAKASMAYYQLAKAYLVEQGEQITKSEKVMDKENFMNRFKRLFG
ncbi:MAG: MinD/ParA family protein [Cellulosilyticum sp.]|nr:MinD/ParA family protein [Cellulosilyticum sp.]